MDILGDMLKQAIQATFSRRQTDIPTTEPLGLTEEFAADAQKQTLWRAFLRRNALDGTDLTDVVKSLELDSDALVKAGFAR